MDKFLAIAVFFILFVSAGVIFFFIGFGDFNFSPAPPKEEPAEILSFTVERPFLIATGSNLDGVRVYVDKVDSGRPEDFVFWGEMDYDEHNVLWSFEIPDRPELIYRVLARGYKDQKIVNEMSLRVKGSMELYNLLWSSGQALLLPLRVGQTGTFSGLSVRLERILEDSRCLREDDCLLPGDVSLEVSLRTALSEERVILRLSDEPYNFDDFSITVIDVSPLPVVSEVGETVDYVVTFSLVSNL